MKYSIIRKHYIEAGHRVYGHSGKCANLHGHSYEFEFIITNDKLDELGMVIDFSIIKNTICNWLDENYDHRLLIWEKDSIAHQLQDIDKSVVLVPYNPTAENIAKYLLDEVGPMLLKNYDITLSSVSIRETNKCSANIQLNNL
jgi:6-pyruvoyltetrahydropterin/6-carboxytetrahydropterin synthase